MLMNYVALQKDAATRMHFSDSYYVEREVWDENLGRVKPVRSLVFWVDELNSEPAARTFSVLSSNLHDILSPYLPDHRFSDYDFIITKRGEGFGTSYLVEVVYREERV